MAPGVLGPRLTEVHPDPPVDARRVVGSEPLDVDRADATEATPVDQLASELTQARRERRKWEVVDTDVEDLVADRVRMRERSIEFGEIVDR